VACPREAGRRRNAHGFGERHSVAPQQRIIENQVICGDRGLARPQETGGKTLANLAKADEGDPDQSILGHCDAIPFRQAGSIVATMRHGIK
jgi:hypothetical protein